MSRPLTPGFKTASLAVALVFGVGAPAANPVTDLMLAANAPYRMALYKTHGHSQDEAQQASAEPQNTPEFNGLLKAVNQSVSRLEATRLNQDMSAVNEATSKLKGSYSKMFAKFG